MSQNPAGPRPKNSETDPPAANQPVSDGPDETVDERRDLPKADEDAKGRAANDPSLTERTAHEAMQAAPGKPDGEVDTRS
jgi:hypothetical protein